MLDYLPARPPHSLLSLLADDRRLRDVRQADVAYAESWSLCYYLMRQRKEQFTAYLQHLAAKPILESDGPEQRVADFERFFGQSWQELDAEFLRSISNWR